MSRPPKPSTVVQVGWAASEAYRDVVFVANEMTAVTCWIDTPAKECCNLQSTTG